MTKRSRSKISSRVPKLPKPDLFCAAREESSCFNNDCDARLTDVEEKSQHSDAGSGNFIEMPSSVHDQKRKYGPHPDHQYIDRSSSSTKQNISRERRKKYKTNAENSEEKHKILQAEFPNWKFDAMTKKQIVESWYYYSKSSEHVPKRKEIDEIIVEIKEMKDKAEDGADIKTNTDKQSNEMNLSYTGIEIYSRHDSNRSFSEDAQLMKAKNSKSTHTTPSLSNSKKYSSMVRETIFGRSSLPQMAADISGEIIICNDPYLHLTKQDETEVCNGTMFSVVEPNVLPRLYRFVASALNISKLQKMDVDTVKKGKGDGVLTDTFPCQHAFFSQKSCLMQVSSILEPNQLPYFYCTFIVL
mmetsp:Transcript_39066/g.90963  ORF Transcript_39066/g.90963 Transcript_39066/m.90963 type:complete len:357 (-) Transcript_39066:160-1230(-)